MTHNRPTGSMRRLLLLPAAAMTLAAAAYNISGVVTDPQGEAMPDATVRILARKDSSFVRGGVADLNGRFTIAGVNNGSYIVEAGYIGYNKAFRNVRVNGRNANADTLRVTESSVMLQETTVIGVKTPIKVMEDTIEFNADSYKTQPNAVVEDLLKRLPGAEVDSEGKITINGKEVSKILIDGKEFFADDPKVASKNLPVNMVEKLQVVDRKSDLARLTGVDDGEDETVINLTVKKGMKNGWFGTVEGGYGTDDRYQANFNINRFWNGNQITFLGSANNTNDLGFTDGNGSRFRRFGGSQGINESQSFGINFNVGKEEIIRVGGNVLYSHTNLHTRTRQNREYLFPDSASYDNSFKDTRDKGHNVRADFRVEWKPDSFNTFDFRPYMSYNQNNSASLATDTLYSGYIAPEALVNQSRNNSVSNGKSWEFGGRLIYNHNFRSRRGRSFSVMANYRFSDVHEDEEAYTHNVFYRIKNWLKNDSVDSYDELTSSHTWANNVTGRLSWTEPLGDVARGNFLTLSYRVQYRWNNADKDVSRQQIFYHDGPLGDPVYDGWLHNDTLSNSFRNDFMTQEIRLGYKKVSKLYNLELGVAAVPSMSKSENLTRSEKSIPERWVWNYAPFLRFRYKWSKQTSLTMFYNGRSSQPSMNQLQPVPDYSNPLNVVRGNPGLKPSFSHNLMLRYQSFNQDHQRSIMTMLNAGLEQNSIISRTMSNANSGGRVTTYENVNGVWNMRLMNMFSQPLGASKLWSFNNNVFVMYRQSAGYNNNLFNRAGTLTFAESPSIAFRPKNLELELRPRYRVNFSHNSLDRIASTTIHNYGGGFNGTWYAPFGIVLATDLNYTASTGYAAGYEQNEWMWNASISYQFLPGDAATIQLKAYDLLQQRQTVNRTVSANYIDNTEYNSLTRYFMLTFTYRFNTFGKGNEPQSRTRGGFGGPGG
ncbi:MAG: outer membrane beta-barrel protein, partial [[Clostridium] fimetarium]|nr:outer membrane beta-barrel protein [[Clostridium] fimetarium]